VRDLLKYFLSIELTMEQLNSQNWVDKIDSILKEIKKRKVFYFKGDYYHYIIQLDGRNKKLYVRKKK